MSSDVNCGHYAAGRCKVVNHGRSRSNWGEAMRRRGWHRCVALLVVVKSATSRAGERRLPASRCDGREDDDELTR